VASLINQRTWRRGIDPARFVELAMRAGPIEEPPKPKYVPKPRRIQRPPRPPGPHGRALLAEWPDGRTERFPRLCVAASALREDRQRVYQSIRWGTRLSCGARVGWAHVPREQWAQHMSHVEAQCDVVEWGTETFPGMTCLLRELRRREVPGRWYFAKLRAAVRAGELLGKPARYVSMAQKHPRRGRPRRGSGEQVMERRAA
jgi:hypothetical protein